MSGGFEGLDAFVEIEEEGAEPLLGDADDIVIPENGDVLMYGDGGAGKTTLSVDLGMHLASGDDWCGLKIGRATRVAFIESEGPRALFRKKLRRKRDAWTGSALTDRFLVLAQPWAAFTFRDEHPRAWLAQQIDELEIDIVFVGPITCVGMDEAGTIQEVREFAALLADVRARATRPITFILIHHENKAGQPSGAWEGVGDTLIHIQAQGHGRTRLVFQKARWSSTWHGKSLQLNWAEGESFTVGDAGPDTNAIADSVLQAARGNSGASWRTLADAVRGNAEQTRKVRDTLLASGLLLNLGTPTRGEFWAADDPACPARLDTDTPLDTPGGGGASSDRVSTVSVLKKDTGNADTPTPPSNDQHHDDILKAIR